MIRHFRSLEEGDKLRRKCSLSREQVLFQGMEEMFFLALLGIFVGGGVSCFIGVLGAGEIQVEKAPWSRILLLPGGLFLCALLEMRFFPGVAGHGMENLRCLYSRENPFPPLAWLVKAVRTIITLASGGSGGIVGPSAYVGAALFSAASPEKNTLRENLFCGAAGGVAALLGTPLGATLFVLESLEKPLFHGFSGERFLRGYWCSFWAWKCSRELGLIPHPHMVRIPSIPDLSLSFLLFCIGGGLFFGILAISHVILLKHARRGVRIFWKSPLSKALGGGFLVLFIHVLSGYHVCGTGQRDLLLHFQGEGNLLLLQGFWKSLATGITVGAGGSAGMVGPTFFVGVVGGTFFAHLFSLAPELFALFGAAAVLGGAANTPVAAMVFLVELCGFSALLPGVVLCGLSFVVARRWNLFEEEDLRQIP